jgi:hypothetical protein
MARPVECRWALAGLAVAVALLAAGVWRDRPETPQPAPRVVLIGVPSLSWQAVGDAVREGRLPTLSCIAASEAALGDIIATGYRNDAEVLASVITGRMPWKHGIHDVAQLRRLDGARDPGQRTVWDWIESRGDPVAAYGFPPGARAAADAKAVEHAARLLRDDPQRHLFLYFDGLQRCERASGTTDSSSDTNAVSLEACYDALDTTLGELVAAAGSTPTTWMLFSERGNRAGPIDYRPRFPRLDHWPPIGFFLAWGDGVKRSVMPQTIAPVDLAATLAYVSGHPVPEDADGLVLFGMLDDGYWFRQRLAFRR